MTQIKCPVDYVPLQQVTAANLNAHVNSATLQSGAVHEQTVIGTVVESVDELLVYDNSATDLRSTTAGNLLGSDINIVTSSISSGATKDLDITANDGTIVAGSSYTSGDGQTVTVTTAAAHNLSPGNIVEITLAGTGYNGTFMLATASGTTFTYVLTTAATAGSGYLSYKRKATTKTTGNLSVTDKLYANGIYCNSSLTVTGSTSFNGPVSIPSITATGTVNITGAFQVNGSVAYVLTEIFEETPVQFTNTSSLAWNLAWTSTAYTKPADELWIVELNTTSSCYGSASVSEIKLDRSLTSQIVGYDVVWSNHFGGGGIHYKNIMFKYIIQPGTAVTSESARIYVNSANNHTSTIANASALPSKFRMYKYKTA